MSEELNDKWAFYFKPPPQITDLPCPGCKKGVMVRKGRTILSAYSGYFECSSCDYKKSFYDFCAECFTVETLEGDACPPLNGEEADDLRPEYDLKELKRVEPERIAKMRHRRGEPDPQG